MAEYPGSTSRDYTFISHDPDSANTAATKTIAAVSGMGWCIQRVDFSYDGDGAGSLTITDGTNTFKVFVTSGGAGPLAGNDVPLFIGKTGAAVTITLAAVSGKKGTLNILYY